MSGTKRSNKQWALRALRVARSRASKKATPEEANATLQRGIRTAEMWLTGTHPKARQPGRDGVPNLAV